MSIRNDEDSQKRRNKMTATEAVKSLKEYMTVPMVELIESSTNPRKAFDEERLEELADFVPRNKICVM
jgi:hypothetical protein